MRNVRPETQGDGARGTIVRFPDSPARPHRRAPASDERTGIVLLFMGVRYERSGVDNVPTPPVASNGSRRRRS
jgi:hypothetical protein